MFGLSAYVTWAIVGALFIVLELVVPGAILGFLGLAAIIVGGLIYYGVIVDIAHAFIAFFIISLGLILFLRSFALKLMPGDYKIHDTDEDLEAIGSFVEVIEEIKPESLGRVRYRDSTWEAESEYHIEVKQKAIIVSRRGNRWIVKPLD